jgi:predicted PurR-regulated permease PerM
MGSLIVESAEEKAATAIGYRRCLFGRLIWRSFLVASSLSPSCNMKKTRRLNTSHEYRSAVAARTSEHSVRESNLNEPAELTRTLFQVIALSTLIAASFWIIWPFLPAILWAVTGCIATWPLMLRLQSWLGGKRSLAVTAMSAILLVTLLAPFYFAIVTIADNVDEIAKWSKSIANVTLPPAPAWVNELPIVGANLAARWTKTAAAGPEQIAARLSPIAHAVGLWFLSQAGNLGLLLVQFILVIIIIAILYANGESAASITRLFARRVAGVRGEEAAVLAAQAVRGVAVGIVVTAVVQTILVGAGLAVVGVPFAALLTAATFVLAIAQIGPVPLLISIVVWVYSKCGAVWGTSFLFWAIFCGIIDNFLRPLLIKRSTDIPLPLIVAGVIGGLIGFGVIGLFIGPVVLAVSHALLSAWMSDAGALPDPSVRNLPGAD